jgi:cytoskeletal protein CcmA (bactofilin family)
MAAAPLPTGPAGTPEPPVAPSPRAAARRPRVVVERGIVRYDALRTDRWKANGTVKVSGELVVGSGDVTGTLSVGGALSAGTFRSRGTLEVEGAVRVRELLSSRGDLRCATTVRAGDLSLHGTASFGGPVTVDRTCALRGTLHAPAVAAGILEFDGSVSIPGEVCARNVLAEFRHRSMLGSVLARQVRLRGRVPNLMDKAFFHLDPATVGRIEADSVELESVDVAFVRAKEIVLGRQAHVTALEGTVVRHHPSSSVGPRSKSPPPYGLRR